MMVVFKVSFCITITFFCSMSFLINAQNFKRGKLGVSFAYFVKVASSRLIAVKLASLEIPNLECTFKCLRNHECYSVNFGASSAKRHVCELLGTDKFRHSSSLTHDPEFDHYYIKTPCMENPCQNGASCLPIYNRDEYKCVCLPGYSGQHCTVNWKRMTTSSVCFGASAESSGQFIALNAGDVITFKLMHQSGFVECAPGLRSHWGCTHWNIHPDSRLGIIITNSRKERLLPKDQHFAVGASNCGYTYYGLPDQTVDSPELLFDNFSTPLHVSTGEQYQIWFGEDLYKCWYLDNGSGKTCVSVYGLFV